MTKRERAAIVRALKDMLKVHDMLMPGVRYVAVQDYQLLNEGPMRAQAALAKLEANEQ